MIVPLDTTETLFDGELSGTGTETVDFVLESDTVLLSLYVRSVTATVTVTCETFTKAGGASQIISFGTLSAATPTLLLESADLAMAICQLKIAHTGAVDLQVVAKGVNRAGTSDGNTGEVTVDFGVDRSEYNEVLAVAASTPTTVQTYVVPGGVTTQLRRVSVSGTNIAEFVVKRNAAVLDKRRTYWGDGLQTDFEFGALALVAGDTLTVVVTHIRPDVGDFNSRLTLTEFS